VLSGWSRAGSPCGAGSRCAQWPGVIPRPLTRWTSRPHFEQLSDKSSSLAFEIDLHL